MNGYVDADYISSAKDAPLPGVPWAGKSSGQQRIVRYGQGALTSWQAASPLFRKVTAAEVIRSMLLERLLIIGQEGREAVSGVVETDWLVQDVAERLCIVTRGRVLNEAGSHLTYFKSLQSSEGSTTRVSRSWQKEKKKCTYRQGSCPRSAETRSKT